MVWNRYSHFMKAHAIHTSQCNCSQADHRIHQEDCQWMDEFEKTYIPYEDEYNTQAMVHLGNRLVRLCCCSAELPHNETMKLKLMFLNNDESYGERVIYGGVAAGAAAIVNKNYFGTLQFNGLNIIGQNRLIYTMHREFFTQHKRVIYLCGEEQSGKTSICKLFSNHMQERNKFADKPKYFKMQNAPNVQVIISRVTGDKRVSDIKEGMREQPLLVIFDDMDFLVSTQWESFRQVMHDFIEQTKICFIITLRKSDIVKQPDRQLSYNEGVLEVPPLAPDMAAKLLIIEAGEFMNYADRNPFALLRNYDFLQTKLSAREVVTIGHKVQMGKSLKQIATQMESQHFLDAEADTTAISPGKQDEDSFREALQNAIREVDLFSLLCFLACFPSGMFLKDYKEAIECGLFKQFPHDWLSPLFKLAMFSVDGPADEDAEDNLNSHIADAKMRGSSDEEIVKYIFKLDLIKSNSLIQFKFERICKDDQILIVTNPIVRNTLQGMTQANENIYEGLMNAITFQQMLLNSLVYVSKTRFSFLEEIVEASSLNYSIVWTMPAFEGYYIDHIEQGDYTLEEIKEVFSHHDTNFRSMFSDDHPLSIGGALRLSVQLDSIEGRRELRMRIEHFVIQVLTLTKICKEGKESLGYADFINRLLNTDKYRRTLITLCFKVELFLADVVYTEVSQGHASRPQQDKADLKEHIYQLERQIHEIDEDREQQ